MVRLSRGRSPRSSVHAPAPRGELRGVLRRMIVTWVFNVVALWIACLVLSGVSYGDSFWVLVLAGLVLTWVNMLIRPIVTILAIPAIILTLGFALFMISLLMLYITSWLVSDFEIDTFWRGCAATFIVWFVNAVLNVAFGDLREDPRDRQREVLV
jgi:putative membrane protein